MELRQLEIVKAVAETGSFTRAGERVHLSQSAVSRQILMLEDELQETLFVRRGRRVTVTPAGETLLRLSQRVLSDIHDTVRGIADQQKELSGQLRLAGGMTVCLYVFPHILREYRRLYPRVDVRLVTGATARLIGDLRTGAADVALLTLPVDAPELTTVPVLREELLLVMRADHALAARKRVGAGDIARQPFVLFESGSSTRRRIDSYFAREHLDPRIVLETENVEILKALVRSGMGVSILPFQSVAREVRAGQFAWARLAGDRLDRETGWVYPTHGRVPRAVEEVFRVFGHIKSRLTLGPDGTK